MCLALLAFRSHPACAVVLAANRDEFHARRTAPAAFWDGTPGLLAGRDLEAGGTWLGVARDGRFSFLTNVRDGRRRKAAAETPGIRPPSRGALVAAFLSGDASPADHLERAAETAGAYDGFNLVAGALDGAAYLTNRPPEASAALASPTPLAPGLYGLSNHRLDTPWPKLRRSKDAFEWTLASGSPPDAEALFAILRDPTPAPDDELPDTGVGLALERLLSPPFVTSPTYGTRSSTVVFLAADGSFRFEERTFDAAGRESSRVVFERAP